MTLHALARDTGEAPYYQIARPTPKAVPTCSNIQAFSNSNRRACALPWAFLAMLCTSVYSLSDKAATAHIESLSGLLGFVSFGYLATWLVLTAEMKISSGRWVPAERPPVWMIAVVCWYFAFSSSAFCG